MHNGNSPEKALLLDLLDYIQQLEKLKITPAFSIPGDSPFVAGQHELDGLPELQYNLQEDGDEIWLRLSRLKEIAAPEPDEALKPWIVLPKTPEKTPQLKPEITIYDDEDEQVEYLDAHPEIKTLFDWYLEHQWQPWASTERPRRRTMVYYNQLFALQQVMALDGVDAPLELVWGIGYTAWKKPDYPTAVKYPLLIQACEVTLNEHTFDLEIRPRDINPQLEADPYVEMDVPDVKQLQAFWRNWRDTSAHRVNPFEPSTYENILKAAAGYLDPSGHYSEGRGHVALPTPVETLNITDSWIIFARKRSAALLVADIENLKGAVKDADSLPGLVQSFVKHGDSANRIQPEQPFRGLSGSDRGSGAMELYFPMPYNDEQVSIVQKLYANDGVIVQGPPGTGKTHTIANVICHYLAQGKRVLVTAKGESALTVLREKIPEGIRDLSVALLANERDGMKQFEHAIDTIASNIARIQPAQMALSIAAAEEKLNHLHAKITHLDSTVRDYAAQHMRNDHPFQGRMMSAEEMAKMVLEQAQIHQWFDDEPPPVKDGILPFDDADINALRRARMAVQSDLDYLGHSLPSPDDFPAWPVFLELHRDLSKAKTIDANITQGDIFALVDSRVETFEKAKELLEFLDQRRALNAKLASANLPWLEPLHKQLEQMYSEGISWAPLDDVLEHVPALEEQRQQLLVHAVDVPIDTELNADIVAAITRLAEGKRAFSLPFGKRNARKIMTAMTVTGFAPKSREHWQLVQTCLEWRNEARKLLARWNGLAAEYGLPRLDTGIEDGFRQLVRWKAHIDDLTHLVIVYDNEELHSRIQDVFGKTMAAQMQDGAEPLIASIHSDLQVHADKRRLNHAPKHLDELVRKLYGCCGRIVDDIRVFLKDRLGNTMADESELAVAWETLDVELRRLTSLRTEFDAIEQITTAIHAAGAKKWATRLRTVPAGADLDTATPASWREAWEWRQAVILLEHMDVHRKMHHLFEERKHLTDDLARTYQELVAEKAWLCVHDNSPPVVRQALQIYLNAVRATGKGTGKKAPIYRRIAQSAMARAHRAVPCWILPQWRVAEHVPAELIWSSLMKPPRPKSRHSLPLSVVKRRLWWAIIIKSLRWQSRRP